MDNNDIKNLEIYLMIVVYGNVIDNLSYEDENYSRLIAELDTYKYTTTTNEEFVNVLGKVLETDSLTNVTNISIKKTIICEEPEYIYEMMYIDMAEVKDKDETKINNIATLLTTNGDIIYYNVVILKTNISSGSDDMKIEKISNVDIYNILYNRVYTNIVTYHTDWRQIKVKGNIDGYCNSFFEGLRYKKLELKFLMHNINIWYIENKYDDSVCDKLIKIGVEKCLIFIKTSENIRGNITVEEVNKILYLSKILTSYEVPDEILADTLDKYDRNIIYNKYKVLNIMYNKHKS